MSSRWLHQNYPALSDFGWQDGYGAFTVSESQIPSVRNYICRQPVHHRTTTLAEEYQTFLQHHGIEFEERYLFG